MKPCTQNLKQETLNDLIIYRGLTLFVGTNYRPISEHKHPLIQSIAGIDGCFTWKDTNFNWIEMEALLVAPNKAHECDANGKKVLIISLEPKSVLGEYVAQEHLAKNHIIDFSSKCRRKDIDDLLTSIRSCDWKELEQLIYLLFQFDIRNHVPNKKDPRIQAVLDYINHNIDRKISTTDLMAVSFLSESRLLHLFKQIMGQPIRNYILWRRIELAFGHLVEGNSLSEASHFAGFSDQAHLTRTFVKTMGIPPSLISKNSKFVQVYIPD